MRKRMPSETSGGSIKEVAVGLRRPRAAFEEGISVRIEEPAMPRGQAPRTVTAAIVKQPGQGDDLRPCAVAAVHGVRILTGVGAEAFIQTGNGIVLQPGFVRAHQTAVFGVENEDHAHERGEHAAVDVVRVMPEGFAENIAMRCAVGFLKAADQFVQRAQHLAGEPDRDLVLIAARGFQDGGKALVFGAYEEAVAVEKKMQRGQHGPVRRHRHLVDGEGDVAGGLAFRGVDEADSLGRDEQADGDAGFAKKTFEAGLRRRVPAVFLGCGAGLVEVGSPGKFFHEDQILGLALTPAYHPGGPQRFAIFGKAGEELVGWSGEVGLAPSPEFLREGREVFQAQVAVEVRDSVATENFLLGPTLRLRTACAFFRACGETTRPSGCTNPIQSWWSLMIGSVAMVGYPEIGQR